MSKRVEPFDELVGRNVRIFRTAKGLSQTELGESIGVTFQQIQKYEKGTNRVASSRLSKIAGTLDVPVRVFFDNSASTGDGPVGGPLVTDLLITPYAVRMLKAFAELPTDKLRRGIAALAESLVESAGT